MDSDANKSRSGRKSVIVITCKKINVSECLANVSNAHLNLERLYISLMALDWPDCTMQFIMTSISNLTLASQTWSENKVHTFQLFGYSYLILIIMKGQLEIKKFICWWCFFDEKEILCTYHTSICCCSTCKSVLREKRQDKGADGRMLKCSTWNSSLTVPWVLDIVIVMRCWSSIHIVVESPLIFCVLM